jgi:hypothetical protein
MQFLNKATEYGTPIACRIVFNASGGTTIKSSPRHFSSPALCIDPILLLQDTAMPSPFSGGSRRNKKPAALPPPAPAPKEERDWAALPGDILFAIFLVLGPRVIMEAADRVCLAWRRVAVGEPKLWRCVDMGKVRRWSSTTKPPWRATARAAVHRAAGQCEAFSGPCDDDFLTYLVERYGVFILSNPKYFSHISNCKCSPESQHLYCCLRFLYLMKSYNCTSSNTCMDLKRGYNI